MSINDALWDYFVGQSTLTDLVDLRVYQAVSPGYATGLLTLTGQPGNTETVVVDDRTYTFQTVLTNVDGNVFIGATTDDSIDNLVAAINLAAGAGTKYAVLTKDHATANASRPKAGKMEVEAEGRSRSGLATTETLTNGSWGQTTMNIYPFVAINQISVVHGRQMVAGSGMAVVSFQLDCVGVTSESAEAVSDIVFALTHGFNGGQIGAPTVDVQSMTVNTGQDLYQQPEEEEDVGAFRKLVNLTITYRESVPTFA